MPRLGGTALTGGAGTVPGRLGNSMLLARYQPCLAFSRRLFYGPDPKCGAEFPLAVPVSLSVSEVSNCRVGVG